MSSKRIYVFRHLPPAESRERYGQDNHTYITSVRPQKLPCNEMQLDLLVQSFYNQTPDYKTKSREWGLVVKEYACDIMLKKIQKKFGMTVLELDDDGIVRGGEPEERKVEDATGIDDVSQTSLPHSEPIPIPPPRSSSHRLTQVDSTDGYEADDENPPSSRATPCWPPSTPTFGLSHPSLPTAEKFPDFGPPPPPAFNPTRPTEAPPAEPVPKTETKSSVSSMPLPTAGVTWKFPPIEDPHNYLPDMSQSEYYRLRERGGSRYFLARIIKFKHTGSEQVRVEFENKGQYHSRFPDDLTFTSWPKVRNANQERLMEELIRRDYLYHLEKNPPFGKMYGKIMIQVKEMLHKARAERKQRTRSAAELEEEDEELYADRTFQNACATLFNDPDSDDSDGPDHAYEQVAQQYVEPQFMGDCAGFPMGPTYPPHMDSPRPQTKLMDDPMRNIHLAHYGC